MKMKSQYQIWYERTKKFWITSIILAVIMLIAFIFNMCLWIKLIILFLYAICSAGALYCNSKRFEIRFKEKYKGDDA